MLDLRPLRSADFRHLAMAYWVNEFGTWLGEIALAILVYDRTHSPLATAGLFLTLRFVPAFVAPPLTTRVEAVRARVALPTLYMLEALLYGALAAAVADHLPMALVLVLAALDAALAIAAKTLIRSATLSGLVKRELLREGNTIVNLGWMASGACAPLIGGLLVAWQGAASALLVDAVTFAVTAVLVATATGIHIETDLEEGFLERLRGGIEVLRRPGTVRRLTLFLALVLVLGALPTPVEIVFAKRTLHTTDVGYGLLLGTWGGGMVFGGAIFGSLRRTDLTRIFRVGIAVVAIGFGILAVAPTLAVACAGSAVGGTGNGAGWVAALTALQERIPLKRQSAVMAVLEGLNQFMPAIGFAVGGAVTAAWSPRVAYAIAAVGVGLVVVIFAFRSFEQIPLRSVPSEDPDADAQESRAEKRNLSLATPTIG
jgi:MFS family permease